MRRQRNVRETFSWAPRSGGTFAPSRLLRRLLLPRCAGDLAMHSHSSRQLRTRISPTKAHENGLGIALQQHLRRLLPTGVRGPFLRKQIPRTHHAEQCSSFPGCAEGFAMHACVRAVPRRTWAKFATPQDGKNQKKTPHARTAGRLTTPTKTAPHRATRSSREEENTEEDASGRKCRAKKMRFLGRRIPAALSPKPSYSASSSPMACERFCLPLAGACFPKSSDFRGAGDLERHLLALCRNYAARQIRPGPKNAAKSNKTARQ